LAKGNIAHAVAALKEGHSIAVEMGDLEMTERFAAEISEKTRRSAAIIALAADPAITPAIARDA
jgi:hypothetical protein